jgi:ribose transport system ATP-binding protein
MILIKELANAGAAVVLVSSDFPELLAIATRILVMRDGRIVEDCEASKVTEHDLILLSAGASARPKGGAAAYAEEHSRGALQ